MVPERNISSACSRRPAAWDLAGPGATATAQPEEGRSARAAAPPSVLPPLQLPSSDEASPCAVGAIRINQRGPREPWNPREAPSCPPNSAAFRPQTPAAVCPHGQGQRKASSLLACFTNIWRPMVMRDVLSVSSPLPPRAAARAAPCAAGAARAAGRGRAGGASGCARERKARLPGEGPPPRPPQACSSSHSRAEEIQAGSTSR